MKRVLAWGAMVIGLWLIISPWFLNYQALSYRWYDVITGVIILGLALVVIMTKGDKTPTWPHWINGIVGLWLIASGIWVFGAIGGANRWNEVIPGILLALLSFLATQLLEGLPMRMYTKDGSVLVEVSRLECRGSDIVMRGKTMGTLPATIYVHPEEVWAMLGLVPVQVVCYLPLLLFRGWQCRKKLTPQSKKG